MRDISQAILELETLNDGFDVPFYEIRVAVNIMKMWRKFKDKYGCYYYKHPIDEHVSQMSPICEILDILEVEFLGSRPKTKHQRLNEVIDKLGIYMQVGKMSEIIGMLVKLRDEEKDV